MQELQGKVAVITGGASGIGRAVAEAAAAAGMKVVLADIEEGPLKEADAALAAAGADVLSVVTDVSVGSSVEDLRDKALGPLRCRPSRPQQRRRGRRRSPVDRLRSRLELDTRREPVGRDPRHPGLRARSPRAGRGSRGEHRLPGRAHLAGHARPLQRDQALGRHHVGDPLPRSASRRIQGRRVGPVSRIRPDRASPNPTATDPTGPPPPVPPQGADFQGVVSSLVAAGIDPADVADKVLDAVRTNRFYILTHDDTPAMVEIRMRDILDGPQPERRTHRLNRSGPLRHRPPAALPSTTDVTTKEPHARIRFLPDRHPVLGRPPGPRPEGGPGLLRIGLRLDRGRPGSRRRWLRHVPEGRGQRGRRRTDHG